MLDMLEMLEKKFLAKFTSLDSPWCPFCFFLVGGGRRGRRSPIGYHAPLQGVRVGGSHPGCNEVYNFRMKQRIWKMTPFSNFHHFSSKIQCLYEQLETFEFIFLKTYFWTFLIKISMEIELLPRFLNQYFIISDCDPQAYTPEK